MGGQALHIGIAGAGIGGLAAAALLARDGHRVTVYDAFEAPRPVGSGLVIQPVGQAVLEEAGAGAAAQAFGNPIRRMLGHEARSGALVLDVSYDLGGSVARGSQNRNPGRYGLAIHRASLFQCLLDTALAAGVELVPSHEVRGAESRRFFFDKGRRAGPFDLLIDASGAGSPLSPLKGRELPYGAIWGTVPWPSATPLPPDELTQRYRRADRMLGVLPIGRLPGDDGDLAAVFWSLPSNGHDEWQETGIDIWKDEASALWPEFAPFLGPIRIDADMTMARYTHGTLRRPYRSDGVILIGDAAHRASPQLGQGANMALLDALALSRALREAGPEGAARLYARARALHVWVYQAFSWAFTPQYQSDSRVLPILRDRILMPLSKVPPLPNILSRLVGGDLVSPLGRLGPLPPYPGPHPRPDQSSDRSSD